MELYAFNMNTIRRFTDLIINKNTVELNPEFMAFCGVVSSHYGIGLEHWMNNKVSMDVKRDWMGSIRMYFNANCKPGTVLYDHLERSKATKLWESKREFFKQFIGE